MTDCIPWAMARKNLSFTAMMNYHGHRIDGMIL